MVILRLWLVQVSKIAGIVALKLVILLLSCKSINILLKKKKENRKLLGMAKNKR